MYRPTANFLPGVFWEAAAWIAQRKYVRRQAVFSAVLCEFAHHGHNKVSYNRLFRDAADTQGMDEIGLELIQTFQSLT
jgi:hypothetical protein